MWACAQFDAPASRDEPTANPTHTQPFPTLLADAGSASPAAQCLYAYSISKDAATPPELPPILYINQARALGWEAVGPQLYLVPLDAPLPRPPGANGSIWDVLEAREELATMAALIRGGLPEAQAALASLPDVAARKGYYTLFAPGACVCVYR